MGPLNCVPAGDMSVYGNVKFGSATEDPTTHLEGLVIDASESDDDIVVKIGEGAKVHVLGPHGE